MESVELADKVRFLRRPATYTPRPARVTAIETHMAWVFLAGELAFKLKKPVRYHLLDYSTLGARRRACWQEIRLNRRLAPHVYLGVVPLVSTPGRELALDGPGTPVDWLVRMRRLSVTDMLDRRIVSRSATPERLRPAADLLVRFYQAASPVVTTPSELTDRFRRAIEENRRELMNPVYGLPEGIVCGTAARQLEFLEQRGPLLHVRVRESRIIEGHGDLRPDHIHLGSPPAVIDCLEFNRELRVLDPADELSFLSLECERLGSPETGTFFLDHYRDRTGDRPPAELLAFYRSFRALLRAKITIWHLQDEQVRNPRRWRALTLRYLWLARRSLPED